MLKRKDKILISALELLDAEGVNGVTTKNLAKTQGVSEPALYRQYTGKQDILNHIIEEYASYDLKIINTIKESDMVGVEAVKFYVKRYAELYQNYSELTSVMLSLDLYYYNEGTKNRMAEILNNRLLFLEGLIKDSVFEFTFAKLYSPKELSSLINGTIFSQIYEWKMSGKQYPLEDAVLNIVYKML